MKNCLFLGLQLNFATASTYRRDDSRGVEFYRFWGAGFFKIYPTF